MISGRETQAYRAVYGRVIISVILVLLCQVPVYGQSLAPENREKLHIMEDSLLVTADSMFNAWIPDSRIEYSERFVGQLVRALRIPSSYAYGFDSLGQVINIIYSDDKAFRIFNWEITPSNVTKRYYGAIQLPGEKLKLIGLIDYSDQISKGLEDSVLSNRHWFGALYYRIMPMLVRGRRMYTLFGMNAANPVSNRKVLDPLTITDAGATFGAPIFGIASENFPRQRINRFVLEYKKGVQVTMNWDKERQMIVFDKLVSQVNDPHRKYTYVPSGQYDGLIWDNDTWNYQRDLIPVKVLQDGEAPTEETK